MFAFPRPSKEKSLSSVIADSSGLSFATVQVDHSGKPYVSTCEYMPCEIQQQSAEFIKLNAKSLRKSNQPCSTIMGLGDYTILSVEAPDVPPTELKAAVRWQIKDLIDFHIDDAVLDVFDAPASGANQRQHNLYVVVSRLSTVQQQVSVLQDAEINVSIIDIPELVLRNICARLPQDEEGVVFVYLAKDRGLIVITCQSTLFLARGMDVGYQALTNAALQSGELSADEFNPEFDRLVLEVQRSLDYYDRYFAKPGVAEIVLSPTPEPIPNLTDYIKRSLGISASTLDLNEIVTADSPLDSEKQSHCLLAVGAAMRQERKTL